MQPEWQKKETNGEDLLKVQFSRREGNRRKNIQNKILRFSSSELILTCIFLEEMFSGCLNLGSRMLDFLDLLKKSFDIY